MSHILNTGDRMHVGCPKCDSKAVWLYGQQLFYPHKSHSSSDAASLEDNLGLTATSSSPPNRRSPTTQSLPRPPTALQPAVGTPSSTPQTLETLQRERGPICVTLKSGGLPPNRPTYHVSSIFRSIFALILPSASLLSSACTGFHPKRIRNGSVWARFGFQSGCGGERGGNQGSSTEVLL